MCGIARPSSGHRIAIMFPSTHPATSIYSLFFRESTSQSQTKAVFQVKDAETIEAFRTSHGIDLRIERHGDLTQNFGFGKSQPLYQFQLQLSLSSLSKTSSELEFDLPERLDLDVSERGIVGRQVTVVATGPAGEVIQIGNGIVGYD
ncbi:uncharacterized protein BJX67DRAFT_362966 [Aspergillus lucknowensis]|uniref:Uncharacterized protein n=1 Tax=Aspergillus lucknowensis TaxID=176173 RepID=A0ABR4LGP9_9EURO